MGKNIIVAEETVRDLLEAHASLCAWYYELSAGLRAAQGTARTPDDATRAAFVQHLTHDFPELGAIAKSIRVPRMYIPAPPPLSTPMPSADADAEQSTVIEPALARIRTASGGYPAVAPPIVDEPTWKDGAWGQSPPSLTPASAPPSSSVPIAGPIAPPAFVIPSKVKYEP